MFLYLSLGVIPCCAAAVRWRRYPKPANQCACGSEPWIFTPESSKKWALREKNWPRHRSVTYSRVQYTYRFYSYIRYYNLMDSVLRTHALNLSDAFFFVCSVHSLFPLSPTQNYPAYTAPNKDKKLTKIV